MTKSIETDTLPVGLYLDRVDKMFNFATVKVKLDEPLCNDDGDVVVLSGLYVLGLTRLRVSLSPITETYGKAETLPDDVAYDIYTEELDEFVQSAEFPALKEGLFIFGYDGVSMTLHVANGTKTFNIIGRWKGRGPKHNPNTNHPQHPTEEGVTMNQETPEQFQQRIDKSMTDSMVPPFPYQTPSHFARGMMQNPWGSPSAWQPEPPIFNPWQAQPNNGLPGYPTPPAGSAFELRLGINGYGYYPREPIMNHPQPSYRNPMQTPPNNCFPPGYPMPPAGQVFPNQPYPPMPVPGPGVWAQQPMKTCTEILIIFNGEGTYSATGPWELGSGKRTVGVVVAPHTAHTHVRFAVNTGCKQYTPPVIDYVIPLPIEQIKVCVVSIKDDVVKMYVHGVEFQEDIEVGKVYFTEKERLRARVAELEEQQQRAK